MANKNLEEWTNRVLVTETLPYEVPVIFTNDKFYDALSRPASDGDINVALKKLLRRVKHYTIPYQYNINKDSTRKTRLSIIHPLWQAEICDFYASHEGSLLSYCANSAFSLRRPVAVAPAFVEPPIPKDGSTPKTGHVEEAAPKEGLSTAHFVSYFVYEKYNLLSKFYESPEFLRLEKRFRFLRTLDVSKCFYHIYTHSVSWAVKSKDFAKAYSNAHSFEGRFDRLMQQANYNETNGIVVGPELSRIFAEIILQSVDSSVLKRLKEKSIFEGRDYTIRRYVDDIAIFCNSREHLDLIQKTVSDELSKIKLYLNDEKTETFERPFVTPLTLARTEIGVVLKSLEDILSNDAPLSRADANRLRNCLRDTRAIVTKHGVGLSSVTGWALSSFNRILARANGKLYKSESTDAVQHWSYAVGKVLELAFHLCALDFRVRTTYSLCQILLTVYKVRSKISDLEFSQIEHLLVDELCLLSSGHGVDEEARDCIELYNVLICGSNFLKAEFVRNELIADRLNRLLEGELTYFKFITLTFCFHIDKTEFSAQIEALNGKAMQLILGGYGIAKNSEQYMLLCDFLSSPLVLEKDKRSVFNKIFGGTISAAAMAGLARRVGFVDWENLSLAHLLRKKELRPVYAVA